MELWEKKLRNAIRTEIRGLVNEGKLDLTAVAENLELDVSALLAEADEESAQVVVDADKDGVHVVVTQGASQEGDEEADVVGPSGIEHVEDIGAPPEEMEEETEEVLDEGDVVVSERWQLLAGLING